MPPDCGCSTSGDPDQDLRRKGLGSCIIFTIFGELDIDISNLQMPCKLPRYCQSINKWWSDVLGGPSMA
jgi:hypothetical protein